MQILIEKALRRLMLRKGAETLFSCRIALGREPAGAKEAEGDGRTPEGEYSVCLVKEQGKYGRSLGLSYPNPADAQRAFAQNRIDAATLANILLAHAENRRPPWGSPLGGEIYLHEGGSASDWTAGCIALDEQDMDFLFPLREAIAWVDVLP